MKRREFLTNAAMMAAAAMVPVAANAAINPVYGDNPKPWNLDSLDKQFRDYVSRYCDITEDHFQGYFHQVTHDRVFSCTMGFPLQRFQYHVDKKYIPEFSLREFHSEMNKVLFNPVNDLNYVDHLRTGYTLPIMAFTNGDGVPVPTAMDGQKFNSDHTHFFVANKFNSRNLRDLAMTIVEHQPEGEVIINLHRNEAKVLYEEEKKFFFEDKFEDPSFYGPVGYFDGIIVEIAPWVPQSYASCLDLGIPGNRPLALRTGEHGTKYQLKDGGYTRDIALGVKSRHKGAAMYFGPEDVYVAPRSRR